MIEHKIGLTKEGVRTGNGLITELENIEGKMDKMNEKIDAIKDTQKKIDAEYATLDKSVQELSGLITDIKNELKDNISFRSFSKMKNTILAIAAIIVAITTIINFIKPFLAH